MLIAKTTDCIIVIVVCFINYLTIVAVRVEAIEIN